MTVSTAFASGLDRSGQSVAAFLQPGHYAEMGVTVVDPQVSGRGTGRYADYAIDNMAESYAFPSAALKLQITDQVSLGLLFDEAFGANGAYSAGDGVLKDESGMFFSAGENTEAEVKANNITFLMGYQPNQRWNLYGGLVYQSFKASVQTRGLSYGHKDGLGYYNAVMDQDESMGWLAGVAYQVPEIGLKAALTYRSKIEHSLRTHEYGQSNILMLNGFSRPDFDVFTQNKVITPQSVNLDLQTGVAKGTVVFLNSRWVNWAGFTIRPEFFAGVSEMLGQAQVTPDNPNGFDLLKYKDNQFSTNLGVGHKMNEHWSGNVSIGWDSGTGEYASTLGPTQGYMSYGVGLQYHPQPNYFIAAGLKYIQIGDAKAQSASAYGSKNAIADFNANDSWAYGLKIGYRF